MYWSRFRRRFTLTFSICCGLAVLFMAVLTNLNGGGLQVLLLVPLFVLPAVVVSLVAAAVLP